MKYLSICSGIEAASVAWEPLGWEPLAFSEIEAFPRAVLAHHYPNTPLHGDFTLLKDDPSIVDADLLCGGTPCQAFSVAGLRQSLADDRGNLSLQFVLLADAIDHLRRDAGREPAWILWENVPGVLSTSDNAFGAFLGGLVGRDAPIPEPADGWPDAGVADGPTRCAAWRILDAQHFGLAQRRRRVFVLARGGAGRWAVADALLPIIESSGWHPAPSRASRQGVAPTISARTSGGGGLGTDFDLDGGLIPEVAGPLCANGGTSKKHGHGMGSQDYENGYAVPVLSHTLRGEGFDASEDGTGRGIPIVMAHGQANAEIVSDGSPSLTCNHEAPILMRMREGKEGGGKGPLVSEDQSLTLATGNDQVLAYTLHGTDKTARVASETDIAGCLRTKAPGSIENSSTTIVAFAQNTRDEVRLQGGDGDICGTLAAEPGMKQTTYIAQDVAGTLRANQGSGFRSNGTPVEGVAFNRMQVRRLTPVECERLQGFPDGYTNIPWRGKPESPDGPRYKALGNSWAVPCAAWIGKQIQRVTTP